MGIAAGTALQSLKLFEQCQQTVNLIGPSYAENYQNKIKQAASLEKMASDKAKTVFFEQVPPADKIKMPDQKNFVKFEEKECKEELEMVPVMNETLRHVVPPQVRSMQTEFKTQI
jgi:cytochrome c551/c552